MRRVSITARVRESVMQFMYADRPMIVRDGDETYTITRKDVEGVMQACGCSESEAMSRLADWVVDKMEERDDIHGRNGG